MLFTPHLFQRPRTLPRHCPLPKLRPSLRRTLGVITPSWPLFKPYTFPLPSGQRWFPPASRDQAEFQGYHQRGRPAALGLSAIYFRGGARYHPHGQRSLTPCPAPSHSRVEAELALVLGALSAAVLAAGGGTVPRHGGHGSLGELGRAGRGRAGRHRLLTAPPVAAAARL